jgi:hypothetical protein
VKQVREAVLVVLANQGAMNLEYLQAKNRSGLAALGSRPQLSMFKELAFRHE